MKITNNTNINMYWRTFKPGDSIYLAGLADGIVRPGQHADWSDPSHPEFQLEIKHSNALGEILVSASRSNLYGIGDNLAFGLSKVG